MHRHDDAGQTHHRHDHVHDHAHGDGSLGWLRHAFAHSHDAVDKVDAALATNERRIWAHNVLLLGLDATATLQLVIVPRSGSTALQRPPTY